MNNTVEVIIIAVGLSMDAVAVSMSNAMTLKGLKLRQGILIAAAFGFFQALMPFLGFLLGAAFSEFIAAFDHFIAFILLGFIGGKMLFDGFGKGEEEGLKSLTIKLLSIQAVATSIDALAVGVGLGSVYSPNAGENPLLHVITSALIIGLITFALSLLAVFIGKKFGKLLGKKAEILGGFILIGIGVKILIEHLFWS